ncbi:hypothetical protein PF011_g26643 [Phytophthora fragariae]|uniref:RxLR effector protein n=1 Tax=Phytophthora fragariae TaxID=53985 RepID=A0A6A3HJI8_9STRA|nr:hypothetical protein PF011_g26643 [Phytophthora fragariae]
MRLYLVLSAAVAVLSTTATSSGAINPATNLVENKDHGIRLLRSEAIDADDEERANMVLGGLIHDSKMTKKKLSSWVKSGNTMETVGARLGLQQGLSLEKNAEHMNYEALVKFIRMKFEAKNAGKQLPYAEFGTGLQTRRRRRIFSPDSS